MKDSALRLLCIIAILLTSTIQKCNSKYIDFSKLKETIVNEPDFNTFITPYIENSSDIRLFTRKNVEDLFTAISTQFPEISRLSNIGKSIENRDMIMLTLGSKLQKNEGKEKAINPPSIFITSAHHAREILSVTMNVYIVLSAVHGYFHPPALEQSNMCQKGSPISCYHNSAVYKTLLSNHNLYILPFVNIDGYEIVSNVYEEKGIFEIVRKNRRIDGNCFGVSIGVDLNRNYGFKWGLDNIGSSPRKCDEDYRGSGPFSEPETQAIRDFIQSNDKNIKIAINLHTWGNLFIIPFNYDDIKNKHMVGTPIYKMYQDIKENGNLPKGMLFGNGMQTIEYTANGDATDWMATQNDMISISPELGIMNPLTDKFFPNQEWVQPIMEENFKWMFYSMMKLSSQLELKTNKFGRISCTEVCTEIDKNYKRYYLEIEISNLGFSEAKNFDIKILETAPFYIATIDGQNKSALIGETNTLKISSLKSLESKVYKMEARIKNSESDIINTETSKSPKPYVEFSFLKYPYLSSYHATSHRIDMVQVTTSDPISIPAQEASNLIIYVFIMIGILIIIAGICLAILIIGKLNRKKTIDTEKVELKQENPKGKRKLQIANLSEDDTEDIGI